MNSSEALTLLKHGHRVRRRAWDDAEYPMDMEKTEAMAKRAIMEATKAHDVSASILRAEKDAFAAMRSCYINGWQDYAASVWHDGKETPRVNAYFLYEMKVDDNGKGRSVFGVEKFHRVVNKFYKKNVEQGKIYRWAYVADLLPKRS